MHAPRKTWCDDYLRLGVFSRLIPGIRNTKIEPSDVYEERLLPFRPRFETALFVLVWCVPVMVLAASVIRSSPLGVLIGLPTLHVFPAFVQLFLHRNDWLVRFGDDGFCVRRLGREGFVPWNEFEGVQKTKRGLVAKTQRGLVRLGRSAPCDRGATLSRLRAKAAELACEHEAPRASMLLAGHPEERRELIEGMVERDFRTKSITQTHLIEDVLNPRTSPALREALADALQIRVDPKRLKEANFVSMRSRRALRSLQLRN